MKTSVAKAGDMMKLIPRGGPALCNVAVTNSYNATCDFCNFSRVKVHNLRWIDADRFTGRFTRALDILYARDIRFVSFFGGEPLLHPCLADMVTMAAAKGMAPAVITNGWLFPQSLDKLAAAGLKTVYVSIDASSIAEHKGNRGFKGVCLRILAATRACLGSA